MIKKMKGFTLIELLIVVAIIGILAALLIPNAMMAIQKAKQKGTMKDINTIATAVMDYITDKGQAPPDGVGPVSTTFTQHLSPFYIKAFPLNDQWGGVYQVWTGTNSGNNDWAIQNNPDEWGNDDYIVASYGRDGIAPGDTPLFDLTDPGHGFYPINTMADFNKDMANWNGSWVIGPRAAQASGS